MGQTYTANYYHIVFSVKQRRSIISPSIEKRLHPFLATMVNEKYGKCLIINGTTDHLHILCHLKAKFSLSDVLRDLKSESSKWLNSHFHFKNAFHWQAGYGCFSVSFSNVPIVYRYIERQKEHHGAISSEEEFDLFLLRHQLPKTAYHE